MTSVLIMEDGDVIAPESGSKNKRKADQNGASLAGDDKESDEIWSQIPKTERRVSAQFKRRRIRTQADRPAEAEACIS